MSESEKPGDLNVRWLSAPELRIEWNPGGVRLTVTVGGGEAIPDARATLAFPMSHPGGYVQISNAKGEQVGMLESMDGLPPDSRAALRAALDARYLIPHIRRILEIKEVSPFVLLWHVETNRGACTFTTESPREAFRHLGPDRVRVTDLAGNHFDFQSISGLDPVSRNRLGNFM